MKNFLMGNGPYIIALMIHIIGAVMYLGMITANYLIFERSISRRKFTDPDMDTFRFFGKIIPIGASIVGIGGLLLIATNYIAHHGDANAQLTLYNHKVWVKIIFFMIHGTIAQPVVKSLGQQIGAIMNKDLSDPAFKRPISKLYKLYLPFVLTSFIPLILGAWRGLQNQATFLEIIGLAILFVLIAEGIGMIRSQMVIKKMYGKYASRQHQASSSSQLD